ncbi:MAG: alpha/beta hydrolase [Chitinophagaceae bacterium]|nr:alpha/beta hydrolase [Chitinophagaceae bacterium]
MKTIITGLFILFFCSAFPQDLRNSGTFAQVLDARPLQGVKFKIRAAVRVEALEPSAWACIWVRVDDTNRKMVYLYNMKGNPIRKKEWAVYTSPEVKMDGKSRAVLFGGYTTGKGYFYFDDFHFYIQKGGEPWEEMPLPDNGFEDDTAALRKNWPHKDPRSSVTWSLSGDSAWEGKACFRADGSHSYAYDNNDTAGKFADVGGIRIYYEEYGQGAPLLLLHGNRGSIADFKQQIPDLSRGFHVIAVDTRGQGRSTEDGKTYTYDLFAEDMNALLDHLHLDSVNVLGWSDGGNTGLIMAMKYPGKVAKLATMGANVFIDNTVVDKSIFRILQAEKREWKDDTSRRAANALRLIRMCETEPRHTFEDLQAIHCPVLVMAGEKDVIKDEHTRQIAAHIPGSRLTIFPGGTHQFPDDDPAAFNKTVIQFFNQ